jgi:carbonic anhydrase
MVSHNLKPLGYFKGKAKNSHCADALIIHCMDFRFQDPFEKFVKKQNFVNGCDHVVLAGGVKDKREVDKHIKLAVTLHNIKKVLLVNHRTCGAYGASLSLNPEKELDTHISDLVSTARRLRKNYPKLKIQTLFADIKEPKNGSSRVEMLEIDWHRES